MPGSRHGPRSASVIRGGAPTPICRPAATRRAAKLLAPFTDAQSEYNRGNALAQSGQLQAALAAYDAALKHAPADNDIRHNRDLVARALRQSSGNSNSSRASHRSPPRATAGRASRRASSQGQRPQSASSGQQRRIRRAAIGQQRIIATVAPRRARSRPATIRPHRAARGLAPTSPATPRRRNGTPLRPRRSLASSNSEALPPRRHKGGARACKQSGEGSRQRQHAGRWHPNPEAAARDRTANGARSVAAADPR